MAAVARSFVRVTSCMSANPGTRFDPCGRCDFSWCLLNSPHEVVLDTPSLSRAGNAHVDGSTRCPTFSQASHHKKAGEIERCPSEPPFGLSGPCIVTRDGGMTAYTFGIAAINIIGRIFFWKSPAQLVQRVLVQVQRDKFQSLPVDGGQTIEHVIKARTCVSSEIN